MIAEWAVEAQVLAGKRHGAGGRARAAAVQTTVVKSIEVTPSTVRLRKRILDANARKRTTMD